MITKFLKILWSFLWLAIGVWDLFNPATGRWCITFLIINTFSYCKLTTKPTSLSSPIHLIFKSPIVEFCFTYSHFLKVENVCLLLLLWMWILPRVEHERFSITVDPCNVTSITSGKKFHSKPVILPSFGFIQFTHTHIVHWLHLLHFFLVPKKRKHGNSSHKL